MNPRGNAICEPSHGWSTSDSITSTDDLIKSTNFRLFVAFFGTTITAVLGALAILANVVK